MRFMQQILRDQKSVIMRHSVPNMHIPNWPEMGVRTVWAQAIRVEAFRRHMPDDWTATEKT